MTSDQHLETAGKLLESIGNLAASGKTPESGTVTALATVVLAHIELAKALREQEILRNL